MVMLVGRHGRPVAVSFPKGSSGYLPSHRAAGFAFLDEPLQEEGVSGFDLLGSWFLSVDRNIGAVCGLGCLAHCPCILREKYKKNVSIDDLLLLGCVE